MGRRRASMSKRNKEIVSGLMVNNEWDRVEMERIHAPAIKICQETGSILDCATSDVCLYLFAPNQEIADRIGKLYDAKPKFEGKHMFEECTHLNWYYVS